MWVLAVIPTAFSVLLDVNGITDIPKNGTCLFSGSGFIGLIFVIILPAFVTSILTTALNVYLAVKAYQVQKQIEKEMRLAGHNSQSGNLKALKKKHEQHHMEQEVHHHVTCGHLWQWPVPDTIEVFSPALRFIKTLWTMSLFLTLNLCCSSFMFL